MKQVLLCLISILITVPAVAQGEVVPDTLEWRLYYPLEIGNAWEWETYILVAYSGLDRREIIGDTLINGQDYFVQTSYSSARDPLQGIDYATIDTSYLRYDTLNARLLALSDDKTEEYGYTCDLNADFGTATLCDRFGEMYVSGGYYGGSDDLVIGQDSIHVGAAKDYFNLGGGVTYYHGVGMLPGIGDGATGEIAFKYVRLGGNEYGERTVFVHKEEPLVAAPTRAEVFPNPLRDQFTISLDGYGGGAAVTLYDVLGREAVSSQACPEPRCTLNVSHLSAGLYFVRVVGNNRSVSEIRVTLVK